MPSSPSQNNAVLWSARGNEVSSSAFSFLFCEMVRYSMHSEGGAARMDDKLREIGERLGERILDLVMLRDRKAQREIRLLPMLQFVTTNIWQNVFGHAAELLKSNTGENEYFIQDANLLLDKFVNGRTCASYAAGMVQAALCCADFPCTAEAALVDNEGVVLSSVILKFDQKVMDREASFGS